MNLPLIICILKIWVLQDVMTSSFVDRYQCFGGTSGILSYPEDGSKMINQPSQDGNISVNRNVCFVMSIIFNVSRFLLCQISIQGFPCFITS